MIICRLQNLLKCISFASGSETKKIAAISWLFAKINQMDVPATLQGLNIYIQRLPYSCGPCSILNVLQNKGIFSYTENDLIELCKAVPEEGADPANIVEACTNVSLQVVETQANGKIQDLERLLDQGCSIIVNYYNAFHKTGHYSVVTFHDEKAIYIIDCALGLIRIRKEAFGQWWHNKDRSLFGWYIALK